MGVAVKKKNKKFVNKLTCQFCGLFFTYCRDTASPPHFQLTDRSSLTIPLFCIEVLDRRKEGHHGSERLLSHG
jgi:hypothetical protein